MSETPEYRIRSNAPFALDRPFDNALTVAAWVESATSRAEAMQPLVSQWRPRAAFDAFDAYDAGHTDGLVTQGYFGAVFDGRYAYFCPIRDRNDRTSVHGRVLRLDTHADFKDPAAWAAYDASYTDGLHTTAYNAGAFDGRYFYTAPWRGDRDGDHAHGRVLRYDTLGTDGAFSLRYGDVGHNGGLCAAVPGPCFIVNTPAGAVSVAAHQTLAPGVHHLAGVYDGACIQLYIDGTLAASRPAGGRPLQQTAIPLTIGHIAGGSARFQGTIAEVYLSPVAQSAAWVTATYHAGPPT